MAAELTFITGPKGSNPGGLCHLKQSRGQNLNVYMKYCFGPNSVGPGNFRGASQPIYEQVTFQLARLLGLNTPNTYVLLNKNRDVSFFGCREANVKDPSGRDFYFVSEYISSPRNNGGDSEKISRKIVGAESPYLDSIHVSDVVGRRQNYLLDDSFGEDRVFYVDLGCSFVNATDGILKKPTKHNFKSKRDLRNALKKLSRYSLITNADSFFNLGDLSKNLRSLRVNTLNPRGSVLLSDLLESSEIDEMERDIVSSMLQTLPEFARQSLLVQNPKEVKV